MTLPHGIWGWGRCLVLALGLSVGLAWSLLARVPVSVLGEQVPLDLALTLHPVAAVVTGQVRHAAMLQGGGTGGDAPGGTRQHGAATPGG